MLVDGLVTQTQSKVFHLIILECEFDVGSWTKNMCKKELLPCRAARELASSSSLFSATWLAGWPPDGTTVKRGHSSPISCFWSTNTQHPSSTLWRPTLFLPINASSHLRRGRWENMMLFTSLLLTQPHTYMYEETFQINPLGRYLRYIHQCHWQQSHLIKPLLIQININKRVCSFPNSCRCSPARSLPCPDTTQCAARSLSGST